MVLGACYDHILVLWQFSNSKAHHRCLVASTQLSSWLKPAWVKVWPWWLIEKKLRKCVSRPTQHWTLDSISGGFIEQSSNNN